jgi:hypothetical protein
VSFKDFDADVREAEGEPITFKLAGSTFTCVHPIPIGISMAMAGAMTKDELTQMNVVARSLKALIVEEQHDQWDQALMRVTSIEVLKDLVAWIVGEATNRPSVAPGGSPSDSSGATPNSTVFSVPTGTPVGSVP